MELFNLVVKVCRYVLGSVIFLYVIWNFVIHNRQPSRLQMLLILLLLL